MNSFDIPDKSYSDWFGKGNTKKDIEQVISTYGEPINIFIEHDGYMACILYNDLVIVVGYDGSEYKHTFEFTKKLNKL